MKALTISSSFLCLLILARTEAGATELNLYPMGSHAQHQRSIDNDSYIDHDLVRKANWVGRQSMTLRDRIPDDVQRRNLLRMIHDEALLNDLDPDLVLSLIEVESGFNRYALSRVGASGLMQVMPFWKDLRGTRQDSLFEVRTNLSYGCAILRHYLNLEKNDIKKALARYNGSIGSDAYSTMVLSVWRLKFHRQTY